MSVFSYPEPSRDCLRKRGFAAILKKRICHSLESAFEPDLWVLTNGGISSNLKKLLETGFILHI